MAVVAAVVATGGGGHCVADRRLKVVGVGQRIAPVHLALVKVERQLLRGTGIHVLDSNGGPWARKFDACVSGHIISMRVCMQGARLW